MKKKPTVPKLIAALDSILERLHEMQERFAILQTPSEQHYFRGFIAGIRESEKEVVKIVKSAAVEIKRRGK